jgi:hypothetical protein
MKLARAIAACFSFALLAAALPLHAAEAHAANVGATRLELPVPDGFVDPSTTVPALKTLGERLTPNTNRLLAIFVAEADAKLAARNEPPPLKRYFMVQTWRQMETAKMSIADFDQVKSLMRQQYQSLLAEHSAAAQSHLDTAARTIGQEAGIDKLSLKLGELQGLEIFDERASSISLLAMSLMSVQANDKTLQRPMAMGITTARIKGKLIYFYAYSVYESAQDLDWIRTVTKDWLPKAASAND